MAAGHTDPHSMLGVAGLAGVLGAKAAMEQHGIRGLLVFFGEPAEKLCGSKPIHAAKGYYDGFDAFIAYHPWPQNTVEWLTHFGAYWACVFTFECQDPEQWGDLALLPDGAGPRAAGRVPGAIDALALMYTNTKFTRDAMFAHTDTKQAPWYVVEADDKRRARVNCIAHLLSQVPYENVTPEPVVLPPRTEDSGYVRPPMSDQTFVPELLP